MRNFDWGMEIPDITYISWPGVPQYMLHVIWQMLRAAPEIFYALSCHRNYIMKQIYIKHMLAVYQELVFLSLFPPPPQNVHHMKEIKRE
jgi:hypothetical protein